MTRDAARLAARERVPYNGRVTALARCTNRARTSTAILLFLFAAAAAWSQQEIYSNRLAIGIAIEADDEAGLARIAEKGGNLEEPNLFGLTPLMEAAQAGSPRCAQFLISHGAKLDAAGVEGFTAVYYAVYVDPADPTQNDPGYFRRRAEVLKQLITAGAQFSRPFWPARGFGLLHVAVLSGNLPCLEVLVSAGASVNAVDAFGETALMIAAGQGYLPVVKFLIDSGADKSLETVGGRNAFDYASEWPQVADYLKSVGLGPGSYQRQLDRAFGSTP